MKRHVGVGPAARERNRLRGAPPALVMEVRPRDSPLRPARDRYIGTFHVKPAERVRLGLRSADSGLGTRMSSEVFHVKRAVISDPRG